MGCPAVRSSHLITIRRLLSFWRIALLALAAVVLFSVPSLVLGSRDALSGRDALDRAAARLRAGETDEAKTALDDGRRRLRSATGHLGGIFTLPVRVLPLLGPQVRAARDLADGASTLAAAGATIADVVEAPKLKHGAIDLDALDEAADALERAMPDIEEAARTIDHAPRSLLVPPLRDAREQAQATADDVVEQTADALAGLRAAPTLLGADRPKRYIVFNTNPAELRGTGGLYGFFAIVRADAGKLTLSNIAGRPSKVLPPLDPDTLDVPDWFRETWSRFASLEVWQNINMSPDLATVGEAVVQLSRTDPGPVGRIDGVIQADPYALSTFLSIVGDVEIAGWDEPITADNVPGIFGHEQYLRFPDNDRRDAFGRDIIHATFDRLLTSDLDLNGRVLERLGATVADGHLLFFSADADAQRAIESLDADGWFHDDDPSTVTVGLFNDNLGENKTDWFLRRKVDYALTDGAATLEIELANTLVKSKLPDYVRGPFGSDIPQGTNATLLGILHPIGTSLLDVEVDGEPHVVSTNEQGDVMLSYVRVQIAPGATSRITARLLLPGRDLDLAHFRIDEQPIAQP